MCTDNFEHRHKDAIQQHLRAYHLANLDSMYTFICIMFELRTSRKANGWPDWPTYTIELVAAGLEELLMELTEEQKLVPLDELEATMNELVLFEEFIREKHPRRTQLLEKLAKAKEFYTIKLARARVTGDKG